MSSVANAAVVAISCDEITTTLVGVSDTRMPVRLAVTVICSEAEAGVSRICNFVSPACQLMLWLANPGAATVMDAVVPVTPLKANSPFHSVNCVKCSEPAVRSPSHARTAAPLESLTVPGNAGGLGKSSGRQENQ